MGKGRNENNNQRFRVDQRSEKGDRHWADQWGGVIFTWVPNKFFLKRGGLYRRFAHP